MWRTTLMAAAGLSAPPSHSRKPAFRIDAPRPLSTYVKAIGVSSTQRTPSLPTVPTLAESGIADFESVGWFGLVAPSGTPREIIARLNEAFVKALKDPSVVEKFGSLGAVPAPTSPEQFSRFIASETAKWGKLVSEAGIKGN